MVEVTDVHDFSKRLLQSYARLESADIIEENKAILKKFGMYLRRSNLGKATISNYITTGTWICQRLSELKIQKKLIEIDQDDFDEVLIYLEDVKKLERSTIKQYIIFIKKFSHFAYEDQPKWIRELRVPNVETRVQPSDLPTQEEFDTLLNSIKYPRDKALIAVMADGGFRIGGILSCLIGSVVFGQYGAMIYLNPEGTNKTTKAKGIPLTWSTGYLNQWLAVHPYKENTSAPLWVTHFKVAPEENGKKNYDKARHEPLSYDAAYRMIKRVGKIKSNKKIFPHLFRHKAVTDWVNYHLTDQQINHRAGWTPSSKQMMRVYGNWTDIEMNEGIWEHYGLKTENVRQLTLKKCPRCNNILKPEDRFCSQCSLVLDQQAMQEIQTEEDRAMESLRKMLSINPDRLKELLEMGKNDIEKNENGK